MSAEPMGKLVDKSAITRVVSEIFSTFGFARDGRPIAGVFNGKWGGSGPVIESREPTTNSLIAQIQTTSPSDFSETIQAMKQSQRDWRMVTGSEKLFYKSLDSCAETR